MKRFLALAVLGLLARVAGAQGVIAEKSPSREMAATVIKLWPRGVVATDNRPGAWGYTEGVLLDGMAAEWHATAEGADFKYVKEAVDQYVTEDGTIKMFFSSCAQEATNLTSGRQRNAMPYLCLPCDPLIFLLVWILILTFCASGNLKI